MGALEKETARPVIGHGAVSYRVNSVARQISAIKQTKNKPSSLTKKEKTKTKIDWAAITEQTLWEEHRFFLGTCLIFHIMRKM